MKIIRYNDVLYVNEGRRPRPQKPTFLSTIKPFNNNSSQFDKNMFFNDPYGVVNKFEDNLI